MNLKTLKKPELLKLARELGIHIAKTWRKPEIIETIETLRQCSLYKDFNPGLKTWLNVKQFVVGHFFADCFA